MPTSQEELDEVGVGDLALEGCHWDHRIRLEKVRREPWDGSGGICFEEQSTL